MADVQLTHETLIFRAMSQGGFRVQELHGGGSHSDASSDGSRGSEEGGGTWWEGLHDSYLQAAEVRVGPPPTGPHPPVTPHITWLRVMHLALPPPYSPSPLCAPPPPLSPLMLPPLCGAHQWDAQVDTVPPMAASFHIGRVM